VIDIQGNQLLEAEMIQHNYVSLLLM